MLFHTPSSIGLYLGSKRIYLAELSKKLGRAQVIQSTETELPTAISESAPEVVARSLEEALRKTSIKSKAVALALSGKEIIIRYFEMPLLPKKERQNAIYFEAHKYMPLDIKELYYDSEVFIDRPQKIMKVVFFASKKNLVDALINIVCEKGAGSIALEPGSLSLMRIFYYAQPNKIGGPNAFVDIHEDGSGNIVIAKDDILLLARDFTISESAKALGQLDFESFVTEMRLSLNYFSKNFETQDVRQVVLFSDQRSAFKDWGGRLQSALELPVEIGNSKGWLAENKPNSPGMAIAMGLGMREIGGSRHKALNLIPKDSVKNRRSAQPVLLTWEKEKPLLQKSFLLEVPIIIGLIFLIHLFLVANLASKQKNLGQLKESPIKMASAIDKNIPLEDLKQKEDALIRKQAFLTTLIKKRVYWTSKMNGLSKMIPDNIELVSLSYNNDEDKYGNDSPSLTLSGRVVLDAPGNEFERVNRWINTLKGNQEFMEGLSDIKINSAKKTSSNNKASLSFNLDCLGAKTN